MTSLGRDPWWNSNIRPLPYRDSAVLQGLIEDIDWAKAELNRLAGIPPAMLEPSPALPGSPPALQPEAPAGLVALAPKAIQRAPVPRLSYREPAPDPKRGAPITGIGAPTLKEGSSKLSRMLAEAVRNTAAKTPPKGRRYRVKP